MAVRVSDTNRAIFFALCLLVLLASRRQCHASDAAMKVSLEQFTTGLSLSEKMRLKLKEIKVGDLNVTHLFRSPNGKEPHNLYEYLFGYADILLIVDGTDKLEELHVALAAQHINQLRVMLEDDRDGFWKSVPGLRSEELYKKTINITVVTTCDEITQIIYTRMNSIIQQEVQKVGETDKHIELSQVFEKLLRDDIDPYMAGLDEAQRKSPCMKTFQLLKLLRGDEASGFAFGKYYLGEELKDLLEPAIKAMQSAGLDWSHYNLSVKVIGYTDRVDVGKDKKVHEDQTGIDPQFWGRFPMDVHYDGCSINRLTGRSQVYINFPTGGGKVVKIIADNCQLGAARAYVTTAYLMNKLGTNNIDYSYATGGVYNTPSDKDNRPDPKKRKIDVEFILKAAKVSTVFTPTKHGVVSHRTHRG